MLLVPILPIKCSLASPFNTNKLSDTLDSVLVLELWSITEGSTQLSDPHPFPEWALDHFPTTVVTACDGWGVGMMWPWVRPDAFSLMLERRKTENWIWDEERKLENKGKKYVRPLRDKTKLQITKNNDHQVSWSNVELQKRCSGPVELHLVY